MDEESDKGVEFNPACIKVEPGNSEYVDYLVEARARNDYSTLTKLGGFEIGGKPRCDPVVVGGLAEWGVRPPSLEELNIKVEETPPPDGDVDRAGETSYVNNLVCGVCRVEHTDLTALTEHVRAAHGDGDLDSWFVCKLCADMFRVDSDHMERHVVGEPGAWFGCEFCRERFDDCSAVGEHMLKHTGDKPFSCHVCLKMFAQKRQYQLNQPKKKQRTVFNKQ